MEYAHKHCNSYKLIMLTLKLPRRTLTLCYIVTLCSYWKTEDIDENFEELLKYSHLVVEAPCRNFEKTHRVIEEIHGFGGISPRADKKFPYISLVRMVPKLCVLEKI